MFKFVLLMLLIMTTLHGREKNSDNSYSMEIYGKDIVENIQGHGSTFLEQTTVTGKASISGSLKAFSSVIRNLEVDGRTSMQNCIVRDMAMINGLLVAENCSFKNLIVKSQTIILDNCTFESIKLLKVDKFQDKQIIDLRNCKLIAGRIDVESQCAEVWVSPNCQLFEELISGASIIKK